MTLEFDCSTLYFVVAWETVGSAPGLVVGAVITSFLFWSFADKITNCLGFAGRNQKKKEREENPKTNVFFASLSLLIKPVYRETQVGSEAGFGAGYLIEMN